MENRIKKQFDLQGKVAVITGASKGIGESMARGLAEYGAKVVVSSRKQEAVDLVAESLVKDGFDAIAIACHVGDDDHRANLINKSIAKYGGIDILINNAGTNPLFGPIENTSLSAFDKIMDVNVKGPYDLSNRCFNSMKERGGGSIINVASVGGLKPGANMGLYNVTKSAIIMLTKSQALEWGKYNIRSNAICPGLVKTKLSQALWSNESLLSNVEGYLAMRRMAMPDEMAGMAVFLASDASSYVTGAELTNDGGHMVT